jgi:hypothetical protein
MVKFLLTHRETLKKQFGIPLPLNALDDVSSALVSVVLLSLFRLD